MATALVLADDGRRVNGRWKRGSVGIGESPNSETWRDAIKKSGTVLDHAPDLANDVITGGVALDAAYRAQLVTAASWAPTFGSPDAERPADRSRRAAQMVRSSAELEILLADRYACRRHRSLHHPPADVVVLDPDRRSPSLGTSLAVGADRDVVAAIAPEADGRLVRTVADKIDHAFISGTGGSPAGTEPVGLLNYSGTQKVQVNDELGLDDLHDAHGLALAANVNMAGLRWWLRPSIFTELRKLKDNDDRYQLTPDPTQDGVFRLLGAPVTVTDRIPSTMGTTSAILADFSQIAVARDQSPTVKILDQTYGDYDQMAIRVTARYDAAPLNAEAVVILTGITDVSSGS